MNDLTLSVTLAVRDLDAVERFYAGVIGLRALARAPGHVAMGAGRAAFLHLRHTPDALPDDPAGAGLFHAAFLLPSRADLGGWLRHADSLGVRLDGAADHLVSEAAYLRDPEGNGVEVYADRPRSGWRWQDGQLVMANARLDMPGLRAGAAPWDGVPDGTTLGHVHLRVGNVAAALPFYAGTLAMDVTRAMPDAAFLSQGGYHHHLAINSWGSAGAGRRAPGLAGLELVTLHVLSGAMPGNGDTLQDPWGLPFHVRSH